VDLPPLGQTFVLHFGEMGSRWGINRTVGQIYALLYLSKEPLNAEDIVERLGVSRSNVSMGLKELQAWNLVRLQHKPGDRRDYFATPDDIWQIVRTLVEERKKREIDPTMTLLREVLMQEPASAEECHAQERMREMHDLFELLTGWYADVQRLDTERLVQLLTLGSKVQKILEMKDRLFVVPGSKFDALLLARFQFAFTVSFHFIFPAFSIGLASYLAVLEGLWLWTGREVYLNLFKYWLKIFALAFAMGVVSGIVMSYQFGTNWSVFSDKAGPIIGPLIAYEVMTAFFLEAGFLGIMLFGMGRVGRKLHFAATLAVAVGTFISAFWILSANFWMQTPVGYSVNEAGQFVPEDWWTIIFNPSFPYRLVHTVMAAYPRPLSSAVSVPGISCASVPTRAPG
jgi:DNA-binding transcriptional regulator GbsR (MarR family)